MVTNEKDISEGLVYSYAFKTNFPLQIHFSIVHFHICLQKKRQCLFKVPANKRIS